MLKHEQGLPVANFAIHSTLMFVTVPCKLETPMSTVVLSANGALNSGPDWAALRAPGYAVVSATDISVVEGTPLWVIENGVTTVGGYEHMPESFPWTQFLLGGAVGALVGHQSSKDRSKSNG